MRTFVVAALALLVALVLFDRGPGLDVTQVVSAVACAALAAGAYGRVRRGTG